MLRKCISEYYFEKLIWRYFDNKKCIADQFILIFSNLGNFFCSKSTSPSVSINLINIPEFNFRPISQKECFVLIKELKGNKPQGAGKLPSWAIIDRKSIIMPHLNFVLNQCILNLVFPDDMKNAFVTHIFKKSDILNPEIF